MAFFKHRFENAEGRHVFDVNYELEDGDKTAYYVPAPKS